MISNHVDQKAGAHFEHVEGSSGGTAVATIAADPDQFYVLDWITVSHSASAAYTVTVTLGGTTIMEFDVVGGGLTTWNPDRPIYDADCTKNQALVVTVSAVGGSVPKLTIRYR